MINIKFFKNFTYKMSDQYFIQLNRSIMELYDRGHELSPTELSATFTSIVTNAHRMVDRRRQAFNMSAPLIRDLTREERQEAELRFGRSLTPPRPPPPEVRPVAQLRPAAPRILNELTPDKHKVLPRAAFEANCAEVCAICLETHKKGDSLTTCCGHEFGKECYRSWIFSPASNHKCPTCRTVNPQYTTYSKRVYRATQRQNNVVVNVVENNVV
ncbi:MAG: RING-H2 finger protein [Verrucomicrobia bacterium]|nr:RING-H2 finger protein [Verrucomicrobiota bacterium]